MSKIKTRAARARARSFKSIQSVTGTWNPGKVRDTMPRVKTRVTTTASPQSHHSRPSISRIGTGESVIRSVLSLLFALLVIKWSWVWRYSLILFSRNGKESYESKVTPGSFAEWRQNYGRELGRASQPAPAVPAFFFQYPLGQIGSKGFFFLIIRPGFFDQ